MLPVNESTKQISCPAKHYENLILLCFVFLAVHVLYRDYATLN